MPTPNQSGTPLPTAPLPSPTGLPISAAQQPVDNPFFSIPHIGADGDFDVIGAAMPGTPSFTPIIQPFDFSDNDAGTGQGLDRTGSDNHSGGTSDGGGGGGGTKDSDVSNGVHTDNGGHDYPYLDNQPTPGGGGSQTDSDYGNSVHSDYPVADQGGTDYHLPHPSGDGDHGAGNDHQDTTSDGGDKSGDGDNQKGGDNLGRNYDHGDRSGDSDAGTTAGTDFGGFHTDGPNHDQSDYDGSYHFGHDLGELWIDGRDTSGTKTTTGGSGGSGGSGGGTGVGGGTPVKFHLDSDQGQGMDLGGNYNDGGDKSYLGGGNADYDSGGFDTSMIIANYPASARALFPILGAIAGSILGLTAGLTIELLFGEIGFLLTKIVSIKEELISFLSQSSGPAAAYIAAAIAALNDINEGDPNSTIITLIYQALSNVSSAVASYGNSLDVSALNSIAEKNNGCIPPEVAKKYATAIASDGSTFNICRDGYGADTLDHQNPGKKSDKHILGIMPALNPNSGLEIPAPASFANDPFIMS